MTRMLDAKSFRYRASWRRRVQRGAVGVMLVAVLSACGSKNGSGSGTTPTSASGKPVAMGTLNIGTKDFAEEYLVSDMYQLLLQKQGFTVKMHVLGQTPLLQKALERGDIDLYPEYTGSGLELVLNKTTPVTDAAKAYTEVKQGYQQKFHLTWLLQSPMNDTNGVAVTQATASKYHLKSLSDLAKVSSQLNFAGLPDCKDRPDCLGGMKSVYGINFKNTTFLTSQPLIYKALTSGQSDAIEVFTTDGPIRADHLVVLSDDKGIFPADHIAPVVRDSTLAKHRQIATVLNGLAPHITTPAMIQLNEQVVLHNADPMKVARTFLKDQGLL